MEMKYQSKKSNKKNTGQLEWYVCILFGEIINERSFWLYCQTKINYGEKKGKNRHRKIDRRRIVEEDKEEERYEGISNIRNCVLSFIQQFIIVLAHFALKLFRSPAKTSNERATKTNKYTQKCDSYGSEHKKKLVRSMYLS